MDTGCHDQSPINQLPVTNEPGTNMENEYLADNNQRLFDPLLPTTYNEAIPNELGVIDLFDIDKNEARFAIKWMESLLGKGKTELSIYPADSIKRKVAHLFFSSRNNERLRGYKNLGFGFPILIKKDRNAQSGLLAAPVFIWNISIKPDLLKEDAWILSETKQSSVRLNPILKGIAREVATLIERYEKKIKSRGVNSFLCNDFCEQLSALLEYQNERPDYEIGRFPEIEDLVTIQESGGIIWSGVIASFPPIHFYSLSDSILSKDFWKENIEEKELKGRYQFCYLPCDHQQKAAHLASNTHKFLTVEGASGSGKTHTICNFLIENLLNGQRTLVVSQSVVELEKILKQLLAEGFGDLTFLFKNLGLDKDNLVDTLAAKVGKVLKNRIAADTGNFQIAFKRFEKYRDQLEKAATAYSKNVFDINNWTETVGLYLKNNQLEGKELLDTQLQTNDFTFDFLEYEQVKDKIEQSFHLFQHQFSFYHPLNDIADTIFAKEGLTEAKNQLRSQLKIFLKKAQKIQRNYLTEVGAYKNALEEHFDDYFQKINQKIEKTQEAIEQLYLQFGHSYNKTNLGNLKILKTFSEKSKTALQLKFQILTHFESLKSQYSKQKYFDFEFTPSASSGNIEILENQLALFENALQGWNEEKPVVLHENIKRLNIKTVHFAIPYQHRIKSLEQSIDDFLTMLNESKLYKRTISNNAMTLQLKQQLLEESLEKLRISQHYLKDFDDFYEWRRLWSTFSLSEEKVIKAIIKVNPKDWAAAFDAWYFHNLLNKQNSQSANFDELLKSYLSDYQSVKAQIPVNLNTLWAKQKSDALKSAKKRNKDTHRTLLKKTKSVGDFSNYFKKNLETIVDFFPVLLMTTETAKELLKTNNRIKFDSLIIKEGANFTKEQGGSLLRFTKKVQVFGSGRVGQIPFGQSFWELAKNLAGKHIYLKNQHRNTAIPLLAFNNAAFEQRLDISVNEILATESLKVFPVDGAYSDDLRINDVECQRMLSLLNQIKGTPQNTFPKLGIACATMEQRDYFSSFLLKIKQKRTLGAEKIQHLERNGMGVYSFDELSGQKFDLLIISLTFGETNNSGKVTKDINYFNTLAGERILQNLLNSGIQQVWICHSLSKDYLKEAQKNPDKKGLFILTNFVEYVSAVSNNNAKKITEIRSQLVKNERTPKEADSSVFIDLVANYLRDYFEPERILTRVTIQNEIHPLVIKGKYEQQVDYVIKADSFFNNMEVFSYLWQDQCNQYLESMGYKILPIWSKDWWKNPQKEARKIASVIVKDDTAFAAMEEVEMIGE